jgi:hypothetical protein
LLAAGVGHVQAGRGIAAADGNETVLTTHVAGLWPVSLRAGTVAEFAGGRVTRRPSHPPA